MRDVAFYYKKKTFPRLSDSGMVDALLGGKGLSAIIDLVSTSKDPTSLFKVHAVHVKVDTLKLGIRNSKHDFLYKTVRAIATRLIKRQIRKAIQDALVTGFEYVDEHLVGVRDRMRVEKEDETEPRGRAEVLKDLFASNKAHDAGSLRSKSTLQPSSLTTGTTRTSASAAPTTASGSIRSTMDKSPSKSQFKIVTSDRRNSILKEGNPSGWLNRMSTSTKPLEAEWKSDIFQIA